MKKHWGIFAFATIAMFLVAACGAAEDSGPVATAIAPQAAATAVPAAAPAAAADPAAPLAPQSAVDPAKPVGIAVAAPTFTPEEAASTVFSFDPSGLPQPTSFGESPIWAAKVAAGELPRVQSRLPREPFVHRVVDQVGEYGGTWRRAFTGPRDGQNYDRINHDQFFLWDVNGVDWFPYMASSIDVEDDAVYTIHMREGLRWSDGVELTADDWVYSIESVVYNEEMNPGREKKLGYSTFAPLFEKVDKYTIRFTFDEPVPAMVDDLNGCCGTMGGWNLHGRTGLATYSPAHFMKQFHPDFTNRDDVVALAKSKGFEDWQTYYKDVGDSNRNPDVPSMSPWNTKTSIAAELWDLERNPYFFAVDEAGNQLPYIDKISMELVEDSEIINLKAIAGEFDLQARHIVLGKLPVFLQNQERGGYHMVLKRGTSFHEGMTFNQTWDEDPELAKWMRNVDFRTAVSLSLDREEVKEVLNLGMGETGWAVPPPGHPWEMTDEFTEDYNAIRDLDRANKLLDDLGLTEKDSSGYRLRSDGSGKRLSFDCMTVSPYVVDTEGFLELVENHTAAVGLEFKPKPVSRSLYEGMRSANQIGVNCLSGGVNYATPFPAAPTSATWSYGNEYADWYSTGGEKGLEPPADVARLYDLYQQATKLAKADRTDILQESWRIHMSNMWGFPTVKNAPGFNDVVPVKNNIMNFVEDSQDFNQWPGEIHTDQMFFVGGKNDSGF